MSMYRSHSGLIVAMGALFSTTCFAQTSGSPQSAEKYVPSGTPAAALNGGSIAAPVHQTDTNPAKPRVVITADPELDDNNTIIRAILYSSDVKFEGLVYAGSQFHWRGDGKGTTQYIPGREYTRLGLCPCTSWRFSPDERFIDNIVDAYAKVYQNLKVHNLDYPSPAELKSKIKWGTVEIASVGRSAWAALRHCSGW